MKNNATLLKASPKSHWAPNSKSNKGLKKSSKKKPVSKDHIKIKIRNAHSFSFLLIQKKKRKVWKIASKA